MLSEIHSDERKCVQSITNEVRCIHFCVCGEFLMSYHKNMGVSCQLPYKNMNTLLSLLLRVPNTKP